jgi:hypothetical protein
MPDIASGETRTPDVMEKLGVTVPPDATVKDAAVIPRGATLGVIVTGVVVCAAAYAVAVVVPPRVIEALIEHVPVRAVMVTTPVELFTVQAFEAPAL